MTAPDVNADVRARLLPCPFCGSPAEYKCEVEWTHLSASEAQHSGLGVSGGSIRHESHRVYCTNQLNCYASMGGWSADAASTLWNRRAAHADLAGELREWQPEETAPDGDLVDVWVGGTENGFRYANAVKLGGIWCDRNGYRLTLKGIRLWIKPPADPALAKLHPTHQEKP